MGHIAELRSVVGQYFMHLIGDGGQHPAQEVGGQHFGRPQLQLGEGQLTGAVDGHK